MHLGKIFERTVVLRYAAHLPLAEHVRQHGLRRAGTQNDQQLVLDIADEAQDREAGEPREEEADRSP
jgi:hypothetical protein